MPRAAHTAFVLGAHPCIFPTHDRIGRGHAFERWRAEPVGHYQLLPLSLFHGITFFGTHCPSSRSHQSCSMQTRDLRQSANDPAMHPCAVRVQRPFCLQVAHATSPMVAGAGTSAGADDSQAPSTAHRSNARIMRHPSDRPLSSSAPRVTHPQDGAQRRAGYPLPPAHRARAG